MRHASGILLVYHVIGCALLRLYIQLQVGDKCTLFCLMEIGFRCLHQRVQIHFAILKLHDNCGFEIVRLGLALGAGLCCGCLFLRSKRLPASFNGINFSLNKTPPSNLTLSNPSCIIKMAL